MKIKIISCEKESFWYSDKIGQEFYSTDYDHRSYQVTPEGGLIRIYDCIIISHTDFGESQTIMPERITKILNRLKNILSIYNH